jgi:ferredoxin
MKKRVTLTFPGRITNLPFTYRLARDFNVAGNIIRARIDPNRVGKMVLELSGDMDQLEAAIEWMRAQEVEVTLESREIVIDEELCVDCGLCTGVCPTEAMSLHPDTFRLNFLRSRCTVCEQCISACPVSAITLNL